MAAICVRCGEANYLRYGAFGSPICPRCRTSVPGEAAPAEAPAVVTTALLDQARRESRYWVTPIRWTPYSVQRRQHCQECIAALQAKQSTQLHQARQKRTTGDLTVLLCVEHADAWRAAQKERAA